MKKIVFLASALLVSSAFAGTSVCDGAQTPGAGSKKTPWGANGTIVSSPVFVKTGFEVICSNNVSLQYNEPNAALFQVGSASLKGNQYFGANSNGGSVRALGKCSADPCVAGDAGTGADGAGS